MSVQPGTLGRTRRLLRFVRRWSLRGLILAAMANLGWDLWSWHDRSFAEGDRRYFRAAERGDEIDYGLAEIRIINETGRTFLIDSFVLDDWGGPYTGQPDERRRRWPAGEPGHVFAEQRYLDHVVADDRLVLREGAEGPTRLVTFQVDRRRPTSCQLELRIREDSEALSDCRPLRRIRHDFRWLFGPPNY